MLHLSTKFTDSYFYCNLADRQIISKTELITYLSDFSLASNQE